MTAKRGVAGPGWGWVCNKVGNSFVTRCIARHSLIPVPAFLLRGWVCIRVCNESRQPARRICECEVSNEVHNNYPPRLFTDLSKTILPHDTNLAGAGEAGALPRTVK